MTVAENLVHVARRVVRRVIDWRKEREALDAFMARMPFQRAARLPGSASLPPARSRSSRSSSSSICERRFLILDEPTSVLTPGEADEMLGLLRGMARRRASSPS